MPYLVRDHLFIGNIGDAAEILQERKEEEEEVGEKFTHILSLLSSTSISFFSEWRSTLSIPTKEIRKAAFAGGGVVVVVTEADDVPVGIVVPSDDDNKSTTTTKLLYSLEFAGKDLKLVRMAVPLRDMESENLLDYLDVCLDFIHESRKEGSVLVHCFAGVSRRFVEIVPSSFAEDLKKIVFEDKAGRIYDRFAAIMTAYLMRTEQLSSEDALESLRQSCEFVCPNDGFLDQLKMYEEMGFKVDHASPIYKRFHLKVLGDSYNKGERIDSSKFGADPGLPTSAEAETAPDGTKPVPAYRCQKCRRVVALQDNVLDHTPGEGESCFEWKRRKNSYSNRSDDHECSSIFVEPLRWMRTVEEGGLEGKLFCAHCDARLGCFNWSGIQCSCGSWITPAFQLHKSRVDISTC